MSGRQKYERRTRHLYALLFESGRAYVGQTVDPRRRERQHRRAWTAPFTYHELGTMVGTYAEAEEHEYAWRYAAHRAGWRVVGTTIAGSAFAIRDPGRRMTAERFASPRTVVGPSRVRGAVGTLDGYSVGWAGRALRSRWCCTRCEQFGSDQALSGQQRTARLRSLRHLRDSWSTAGRPGDGHNHRRHKPSAAR